MVAKEDVVSLIVEGDHFSAFKLRLVVKDRGKHATDSVAQSCGHVVDDYLRTAVVVLCSMFNLFYVTDATQAIVSSWPRW